MYLHLVESHLWDMMRDLRSMTHADEGAIERLHHLIAELTRRFAPVQGWTKRRTAIMKLQERESASEVVMAQQDMLKNTKRKFAQVVGDAKIEKQQQKAAVKAEGITTAANNAAAVLGAQKKQK